MTNTDLFKEIRVFKNVLSESNILFDLIKENTNWDISIKSRKTGSYGKPYNYSNLNYDFFTFPPYINEMANLVNDKLGFIPNNCLINYYEDGDSKMGFHSDQIDLLKSNSGIAIFSIGNSRIMRFKNKLDKDIVHDIILEPNSLFYMSKNMQKDWLHSVLSDKKNINNSRISITFRQIKE